MQGKMNMSLLPIDSKHLFEELCSEWMLLQGYRDVKKNRGTAGIDRQTIEDFGARLDEEIKQLRDELMNWTYTPKPVRRVEIPKPDGGGVRLLGIPCVRDRIVQASIKRLLEPILEPLFSEHSYGFRPGRNQAQAVEAAQNIVSKGKRYVVDIDLSKFFDRVNQDRLIGRLGKTIEDKRILRLVGMILRSGIMADGVITPSLEGTVQGSPLSPLLSNLVLDELDKEIESRGLEFCRFADDCNIFAKSQRSAERIMNGLSAFIEKKLKLVVNREKSQVAESSLVKFLGMTIINGTRAISRKSLRRAMNKVKELIPRGTNAKLEASIKQINSWYVGWSSYYGMTQYPSQLKSIEAHIRRRLRSRIIDQQKSNRNLFNKLVKRGVSKAKAKVIFSNKKRWSLSHTRPVESAYSNRWFEEKGLQIRSSEKREHWFGIEKWVRLT